MALLRGVALLEGIALLEGVASLVSVTPGTEYSNIKYSKYSAQYVPFVFATTPDKDGDTETVTCIK